MKAVHELWDHGAAMVAASLGLPAAAAGAGAGANGAGVSGQGQAAPFSVAPAEVVSALACASVPGSWLVAAQRCRQQRLIRLRLFADALAAGRRRLHARRLAALAALSGRGSVAGKRPRHNTAAEGLCLASSGAAVQTVEGSAAATAAAPAGAGAEEPARKVACLLPELMHIVMGQAGLTPELHDEHQMMMVYQEQR